MTIQLTAKPPLFLEIRIQDVIERVDKNLAELGTRELLSTVEAADLLLDVRLEVAQLLEEIRLLDEGHSLEAGQESLNKEIFKTIQE